MQGILPANSEVLIVDLQSRGGNAGFSLKQGLPAKTLPFSLLALGPLGRVRRDLGSVPILCFYLGHALLPAAGVVCILRASRNAAELWFCYQFVVTFVSSLLSYQN